MQIIRNSIDTQKGPADWFSGDTPKPVDANRVVDRVNDRVPDAGLEVPDVPDAPDAANELKNSLTDRAGG
jgi:hypothetical protein